MEPVTSDLFKKKPNPLEGQAKARPSAKSVKASFGKNKTQKNSEVSTENNAKRKSESDETGIKTFDMHFFISSSFSLIVSRR